MPCERSSRSSTASATAGSVKLGQPVPLSNLASERNSSAPHAAHRKEPWSLVTAYGWLNGRSVPCSRSTWYCSGVRRSRHSSSVRAASRSITRKRTASRARPGAAKEPTPTVPPLCQTNVGSPRRTWSQARPTATFPPLNVRCGPRASRRASARGVRSGLRWARRYVSMSTAVDRRTPAPASAGMRNGGAGRPPLRWPRARRSRRPSSTSAPVSTRPSGRLIRSVRRSPYGRPPTRDRMLPNSPKPMFEYRIFVPRRIRAAAAVARRSSSVNATNGSRRFRKDCRMRIRPERGSPEVCVARSSRVTSAGRSKGTWPATGSSSPTSPRSDISASSSPVNVLVIEPISISESGPRGRTVPEDPNAFTASSSPRIRPATTPTARPRSIHDPSARSTSRCASARATAPQCIGSPPMTHRMLLDTSSLMYRAFFALPASITGPTGTPVNALHGYLDMTARLIRDRDPEEVVHNFDDDWRPAPRVASYDGYKATRAVDPEGLPEQFEVLLDLLPATGMTMASAQGWEAEDAIGTLCASAGRRDRIDIVTGDRDLIQLVRDPGVRVLFTRRGVSELDVLDEPGVEAKYGVPAGTPTSPSSGAIPRTSSRASAGSARRPLGR